MQTPARVSNRALYKGANRTPTAIHTRKMILIRRRCTSLLLIFLAIVVDQLQIPLKIEYFMQRHFDRHTFGWLSKRLDVDYVSFYRNTKSQKNSRKYKVSHESFGTQKRLQKNSIDVETCCLSFKLSILASSLMS
ncbi:Protein of unknown function [Cotesia congregata]|uniref:Uncharacterized protein n=1 Tax=Cotesia congregata TaxID=51543 RepID=A0A8J2HS81_COTCN|nr:Protein of unknown function [Cotesia congregata]